MPSAAVLNRHLLVWREPAPWPFMWRGLLPLIALALVLIIASGPFARGAIESGVQSEIGAQLSAAGMGWAAVTVSGQNVTLSGEAPASAAGERAVALARSATCPTWSGRRICAVNVVGRFHAPAPLGAATPLAAAQLCERALEGIVAKEQILFASGSAAIDTSSAPLLDRLARAAQGCPGMIRIEGHTDIIGRNEFNRSLSEARAAAVRDALIARGVPAERLRAQGLGAARPIADNQTESGRARNRRIEFHASAG
jgi:outer membrane protein OmpA-like peptidoglycan-associated protein